MARTCDLTGKRRLIGHKVSHSNIKTKMAQQKIKGTSLKSLPGHNLLWGSVQTIYFLCPETSC